MHFTKLSISPWFLLILLVMILFGQALPVLVMIVTLLGHELAHMAVAEGLGAKVAETRLLPFGGAMEIVGLANRDPGVEVAIALAGPFENLVISAVGLIIGRLMPIHHGVLDQFVFANLAMAFFNLLPAVPLDGGRIARRIWTERQGYQIAKRRMFYWGQGVSLGSLFFLPFAERINVSPISVFLFSLFLFFSSRKEEQQAVYPWLVSLTAKEGDIQKRGLMPMDDLLVLGTTPLKQVLRNFLPHRYHRISVRDRQMNLLGTLDERDLLDALVQHGLYVAIQDILPKKEP